MANKMGVKHLIKCVCVLPQLSKMKNPPSHEFPVFSTYDDDSQEFDTSYVQCTNCGVVHKIIDLCESVILKGKDELRTVAKIDDVKNVIPEKIAKVLEQYEVDMATWQNVAWIVESSSWGQSVVLASEYIDGVKQGKSLTIIGRELYKINSFAQETAAEND